MNNARMACGLDDPRLWDEAIDTRVSRALEEQEDADPRTEAEKRMNWVCEYWGDALVNDTADGWAEVRDYLLGSAMTLIYSANRREDAAMVAELQSIAFENQLACIRGVDFEN